MSRIADIRLNNITEALKPTDVFAVYRNKTWIPVKGLRFDDLIFGDPTVFDGNLQINGYINADSFIQTIVVTSATETIDSQTFTRLEQDTAGITTTLSNISDSAMVSIANRSTGDTYFNHDIELQGTVYTAPVTIPSGDVYNLTYDNANGRFVF